MIRLALALLLATAEPGLAAPRSSLTPDTLATLAFVPHPGRQLPLDAPVTDAAGRTVPLGAYFQGAPVILVLDYLHCRTLCGLVLGGLATALDQVPLTPARDYRVLALSIDPRETTADAAAAQAQYRRAHWQFATAPADTVAAVADAVGFPYRYDPAIDQYAHPAGITLVAPDGRIARYLLGVDIRPLDLRLGLADAAVGRTTAPATRLLLLCYGYDPQTGRYGLAVRRLLQAGGAVTLLGLAVPVALMLRRERRR